MNPNFSLAPGFHAVVIGGAGDIGAAISNQFCDLGATVSATGANEADLARTLLKPRAGLTLADRYRGRSDDSSSAGTARRSSSKYRYERIEQAIASIPKKSANAK